MQPYMQMAVGSSSLTTTTSYQTVPGLSFNVAAGGTYRFAAFFLYQGSSTSASFRPSMGGTCTATMTAYHVAIQTNANGTANNFMHDALSPSASGGAATAAATTNYGCRLSGLIGVNAAGTLVVQASHVTAAGTVQTNGRLILEQLA